MNTSLPTGTAQEFPFSLLVPSQSSYLSKSFCFQGFLISKAAVPGGSTGGSQWVAVSQGLPVWEIDAAHAAKRRHPALLGALDPASVEGDLVGAAGAGCCARRGVYARPHPSGGAVGVPPAAAPGDGCTIRPQSHSAKNPAGQQVSGCQPCCSCRANSILPASNTPAKGKTNILASTKKGTASNHGSSLAWKGPQRSCCSNHLPWARTPSTMPDCSEPHCTLCRC